jgi:hypothetical protein
MDGGGTDRVHCTPKWSTMLAAALLDGLPDPAHDSFHSPRWIEVRRRNTLHRVGSHRAHTILILHELA